jgi:hypothetical protein
VFGCCLGPNHGTILEANTGRKLYDSHLFAWNMSGKHVGHLTTLCSSLFFTPDIIRETIFCLEGGSKLVFRFYWGAPFQNYSQNLKVLLNRCLPDDFKTGVKLIYL